MPIAIAPNGQRYRFSVPYRGERFQVTRYAAMESSAVDHVIVEEFSSGYSITADEEDAVLIDNLCAALTAGEILASVLEEKLDWYFKASSH